MWYKKYGWDENPFSVKPAAERLVGLDERRDKLLDFVHSGTICFLTGSAGVGKSSMLKWIQHNVKGHTPIYIDAEQLGDELFDLSEYLKQHRTLWETVLGHEYPKSVVVLLDEAHATEDKLKKALKLYWDHDYIKSIVITQIPSLNNFSSSVRNRVGNRVIKLDRMEGKNVHKMIELRTEGKNPLTKDAINFISKKSNFIPRKILENCEAVCIALRGKKDINASDVRKVLGKKDKKG